MKKLVWGFGTAGVMALALAIFIGFKPSAVDAAKVGPAETVTLNPGGGKNTDGTDGMRFAINGQSGKDEVFYRNTNQYCCSAGAPMLNIGGTLYGQAGPAGTNSWSSLEVLNTTGATSEGDRTSVTGNASATLLYTVDIEGLVYTITRKMTYTYPNDYVTDAYTFNIPEGNASTVKFYLGGDTAPGGSDQGYGIMLTSPVRSIISLNTSSRIMFGFREVPGSKAFDGATSQHYSAPYNTVTNGGDIDYVVTASTHDAGLMMQWNLGSDPGTQTASLQQFATKQGTNLNATLSAGTTAIDDSVTLNISIVNTELTPVDGLGFLYTLPAGVKIAAGEIANSCAGSISAASGADTIQLEDGEVASGSNCVMSVPIHAVNAGTYVFGASNFGNLTESLENNAGAMSLVVSDPEVGSDLNGDGIDDAEQENVFSYTNPLTNKTVALESSDACSVVNAESANSDATEAQDEQFTYINGMMDFTLSCGTPGITTEINQYYYDVTEEDFVLRKYNPNTQAYATVGDYEIGQVEINSKTVTKVAYEITDGAELDTDGAANGTIVDPIGLAQVKGDATPPADSSQSENTDTNKSPAQKAADLLSNTGQAHTLVMLGGAAIILLGTLYVMRSRKSQER